MNYATREEYRTAWEKAYTDDPPIPLNLDIEIASACNARCTFCLYADRDWDAAMKMTDWDGKPKRRLMPTKMALRLIDDAAAIGIPAIKTNFRGESTLHPDYSEIMQYASDRKAWRKIQGGISKHFNDYESMDRLESVPAFHEILVNTNGNCPGRSIDGLMAATKVMVSLDSMDPEIYPKVRVGLSLEHAKNTIDTLVSKGHPDLWVRRVVCRDNKDEKFVEAVKARWPTGVKVSEHFVYDRNHYEHQATTDDDVTKWPRKFCGYPAQRIVVEASGCYVPCCIAWAGEFDAGKYPDLSLEDYWASEWRRNLAAELRRGEFKNEKCRSCTSFMAYDVPQRDFVHDVEAKA